MRTSTNTSFKKWQALPPLPLILNLEERRSAASPSRQRKNGKAGETRPSQVPREDQGEFELGGQSPPEKNSNDHD